MDKLFTQQDLAKRWQVTVKTIENYRLDGIITPVRGLTAIRFTPEHIAEVEGVKLERFSPLERRKMEKEIAELRKQNELLREILGNVLTETSKIINLY